MKNINKKGFTIVEVVIVIAVIATLAAVMVPTLTCMFDRARVSNDRQEARNTYSYYLQNVDYVAGEQPVKNGAVLLKDGTLVKLESGNVLADEKIDPYVGLSIINSDGEVTLYVDPASNN